MVIALVFLVLPLAVLASVIGPALRYKYRPRPDRVRGLSESDPQSARIGRLPWRKHRLWERPRHELYLPPDMADDLRKHGEPGQDN